MKRSLCIAVPSSFYVRSVIYNYKCPCEAEYINSTYQSLVTRIVQNVSTKIHQGRCYNLHNLINSAIVEHLINILVCAASFTRNSFTIMSWTHFDYNLNILHYTSGLMRTVNFHRGAPKWLKQTIQPLSDYSDNKQRIQ